VNEVLLAMVMDRADVLHHPRHRHSSSPKDLGRKGPSPKCDAEGLCVCDYLFGYSMLPCR